jgi:hypothetical protein
MKVVAIALVAGLGVLPQAPAAAPFVMPDLSTARGLVASVGQETFDVVLRLRLTDGAILSASMENPVVTIERRCRDLALR